MHFLTLTRYIFTIFSSLFKQMMQNSQPTGTAFVLIRQAIVLSPEKRFQAIYQSAVTFVTPIVYTTKSTKTRLFLQR